MVMDIRNNKYVGSLFGVNYNITFETDEEFVAWLVAKLKKQNPLLPKIMDALLNESEDFKALKTAEILPSK